MGAYAPVGAGILNPARAEGAAVVFGREGAGRENLLQAVKKSCTFDSLVA